MDFLSKLSVLLVLIILISIKLVQNESINCEEVNQIIKPCECLDSPKPHTFNLYCIGNGVNNTVLNGFQKQNKSLNFRILYIKNTNITEINSNTFKSFTFEQIFLEENEELHTLNETAFNQSSVRYLVIRNNTKLDQHIFGLVKNVSPNEVIELVGNGLTEIPVKAFGDKNIIAQYVHLYNNKITAIKGSDTFKQFPNLIQLSLDYNEISELNGLEFYSPTNGSEHNVEVFLNNNHLNEKSFKLGNYLQNKVNVKLYLENNNFTNIPNNVFEPILKNNKSEVYFGNNEFQCDCNMTWILDYRPNVFNVWCSQKVFDKSIFSIDKKELCKY